MNPYQFFSKIWPASSWCSTSVISTLLQKNQGTGESMYFCYKYHGRLIVMYNLRAVSWKCERLTALCFQKMMSSRQRLKMADLQEMLRIPSAISLTIQYGDLSQFFLRRRISSPTRCIGKFLGLGVSSPTFIWECSQWLVSSRQCWCMFLGLIYSCYKHTHILHPPKTNMSRKKIDGWFRWLISF